MITVLYNNLNIVAERGKVIINPGLYGIIMPESDFTAFAHILKAISDQAIYCDLNKT